MDQILIELGKKILEGNLIIIGTVAIVAIAISIFYVHKIVAGKIEKTNNEEISSQVENSISLIINKLGILEKSVNELQSNYKKDFKQHDVDIAKSIRDLKIDLNTFIDKSRAEILHKMELDNVALTNNIYNHISNSLSSLETSINNDLVNIRLQRTGIREEIASLNTNISDIKRAVELLTTLNNNIRLMPLKNNVLEE